MIEKLKLINNQLDNSLTLHPEITNILFEHRRQIKNIFLQINGLHELSHFGIIFINPVNELVAFSTTPHIEYNLIKQKLWSYDPSFSEKLNKNTIYFWDEISPNNLFVEEINKIKLSSNDFTIGMTISRKFYDFCCLYSYATKSKDKNLHEYYASQIYSLIDIGDYFCKSILNIYSEYSGAHSLSKLYNLPSRAMGLSKRTSLKLVINNL